MSTVKIEEITKEEFANWVNILFDGPMKMFDQDEDAFGIFEYLLKILLSSLCHLTAPIVLGMLRIILF